jgi:hypothetical protein
MTAYEYTANGLICLSPRALLLSLLVLEVSSFERRLGLDVALRPSASVDRVDQNIEMENPPSAHDEMRRRH